MKGLKLESLCCGSEIPEYQIVFRTTTLKIGLPVLSGYYYCCARTTYMDTTHHQSSLIIHSFIHSFHPILSHPILSCPDPPLVNSLSYYSLFPVAKGLSCF